MIKGAQRRMIVVKTVDSDMFYEAHFWIRQECERDELDMLAEAEKIVGSVDESPRRGGARLNKSIIFGIGGVSIGAVCGALVSIAMRVGI